MSLQDTNESGHFNLKYTVALSESSGRGELMNMCLQHSLFPLVTLNLFLNFVVLYVYKEKQDQAVCTAHSAKSISKMYLNTLSIRNRQCVQWYQLKSCRNDLECQDLIYFSFLFIFFRGQGPCLLCVLLSTTFILTAYLMVNKHCFEGQLEYLCFGF